MTALRVLDRADTLAATRAALSAGFAGARRGRLPVISIPAPRIDVERFAGRAEHTFVFDPFCAAEGIAVEIETTGETRFDHLIQRSKDLYARLDQRGPIAPRLFGGFAFRAREVNAAPNAEWAGFPDVRFVLPRWAYLPGVLIHAGDDETAALRELDAFWPRFERPLDPAPFDASTSSIETEPTLASWSFAIEEILSAIRRRRAKKVVLARSTRLMFDREVDDLSAYARLIRPEPGLRYLLRTPQGTLLGATPERLLKKNGDRIDADAVAGTASAEASEALNTSKQLREHHFVVEHLAARLEPFLVARDPIAAPSIRAAGSTISHLHTPIHARARAGVTLFELARAIHPTPAICGEPVPFALDAIARSEPFSRGWYTGAVGWMDASGDGELYVALRCAVLQKDRAYLYAGAGIVEGSEPVEEYSETAIKERVMMRALGAVS